MSESGSLDERTAARNWLAFDEPVIQLQIIRACLERMGVVDIGIGFPECFAEFLPPAVTLEQIREYARQNQQEMPEPTVAQNGYSHTPINQCVMLLQEATLESNAANLKKMGDALHGIARKQDLQLKIPQRSVIYHDWPAALDWNFWLHQLVTRNASILTWPAEIVGELLRWAIVWSGSIEKPHLRGRTAEWQLVILGMVLSNLDQDGNPIDDLLSRCWQAQAIPPAGGGMTDQQLNAIAASLAGQAIPVAASRQAILAHLPAARVSDLRQALQAAQIDKIPIGEQAVSIRDAKKNQLLDFIRTG